MNYKRYVRERRKATITKVVTILINIIILAVFAYPILRSIIEDNIQNKTDSFFAPISDIETATVMRVVDGDTLIYLDENSQQNRLRFIGVDTPETVHPTKEKEFFGEEASNFTKKELYPGREIFLEQDISDVDQYNRKLRYIWLEKPEKINKITITKKMFNAILLKKGYARFTYFPPDEKYKEIFEEIEEEAIQQKIGLWQN